jgi:hypothetical protein
MRRELQDIPQINFIQTTLLTGLTNVVTGQLKSLITEAIKNRTGRFLKDQFKKRAIGILREWLMTQLRGKFVEYFTEFIITYIENNVEKILDTRLASHVAEKIVNNIISGLGTYLFKN